MHHVVLVSLPGVRIVHGMSIVNHVVRTPWRWSRWLLPRLWLVIPMGLAVYSLTEPWARARIVLFWGISRSPGALMLVLVSSLVMVVAGGVVAGRRRALGLAACVHLASGALMCAVAWRAYQMVQEAGVKALGFIPLASVRPGPGLQVFCVAALFVLAVGAGELGIALVWRRRRPPAPPAAASDVGTPACAAAATDATTHVPA